MLRRLAALGLLVVVAGCSAGVWVTVSAITGPFIAPGAADVQVSEIAPGERQITYSMPNPGDGWLSAVARRLSLSGWSIAADKYQWGGTETITTLATYTRTSRIWFLEVRERAELQGNRSNAFIRIRYTIISQ
jgi:hypothetical protein